MGKHTKIEWTDHTFNPWEGCQKVGPGCDNCYAETRNHRFSNGVNWGPGAPRRRTSASNWNQPIKWDKAAAADGTRPFVFCASLADVFDNAVHPLWRADLFRLIDATPHLVWLLLTKRVGNVAGMIDEIALHADRWPRNAWLGATIVNQEEADRDIPKLLATKHTLEIPRAFLSCEPLLGQIDLAYVDERSGYSSHVLKGYRHDMGVPMSDLPSSIDWVIAGGESGPNARPMHPDWARSLRDQCAAAGVPFLFKQWGAYLHESQDPDLRWDWDDANERNALRRENGPHGYTAYIHLRKEQAGRKLDGIEHDGRPSPTLEALKR